MKRILAYILGLSLVFSYAGSCFAMDESQYTIEDGFLTGSITLDGVPLTLDALFDDSMAMPPREVLVVPPPITKADVMKQVEAHFNIPNDFAFQDGRAGWFYFCTLQGYYSPEYAESVKDYRQLTPHIQDDTIRKAVQQCKDFMDTLGVEYYPVPTYAVYGDIGEGPKCSPTLDPSPEPKPYVIRFANSVDGMAIDPAESGGKRGDMKIHPDRVMTNSPYTTFVFWETGELASLKLHTFAVAESYPVAQPLITWQEALTIWCTRYRGEPMFIESFEDSELSVIRVQAVWLTTYNNILRPGWYIEVRGSDKDTGKPYINQDGFIPFSVLGVDAVTGDIH